jgi:hypothetical protein
MTAKAMIFVQLVREIAANEHYRLHFYVDGWVSWMIAILRQPREWRVSKGIIPITADPRLHLESLAHLEVTVYSLGQAPDGRFYVDAYKRPITHGVEGFTQGAERSMTPFSSGQCGLIR